MRLHRFLLMVLLIAIGISHAGCISAKKSRFQTGGPVQPKTKSLSADEERAVMEQTNKMFAVGIEAEQQGDLKAAEWAYLQCLQYNQKKGSVKYLGPPYHRLAVIAARQGNTEKSEEYFRKSLELGRENPELACDFAQMLIDGNRLHEATTILENALITFPQNKKLLFFLGHTLAVQNREIEALRHMKASIGESAAYDELAQVLREKGNLSGADLMNEKGRIAKQNQTQPLDNLRDELNQELNDSGIGSGMALLTYSSKTPKMGSINRRYREVLDGNQAPQPKPGEQIAAAAEINPADVMMKYGRPEYVEMPVPSLPASTAQPKFSDIATNSAPSPQPAPRLRGSIAARSVDTSKVAKAAPPLPPAPPVPPRQMLAVRPDRAISFPAEMDITPSGVIVSNDSPKPKDQGKQPESNGFVATDSLDNPSTITTESLAIAPIPSSEPLFKEEAPAVARTQKEKTPVASPSPVEIPNVPELNLELDSLAEVAEPVIADPITEPLKVAKDDANLDPFKPEPELSLELPPQQELPKQELPQTALKTEPIAAESPRIAIKGTPKTPIIAVEKAASPTGIASTKPKSEIVLKEKETETPSGLILLGDDFLMPTETVLPTLEPIAEITSEVEKPAEKANEKSNDIVNQAEVFPPEMLPSLLDTPTEPVVPESVVSEPVKAEPIEPKSEEKLPNSTLEFTENIPNPRLDLHIEPKSESKPQAPVTQKPASTSTTSKSGQYSKFGSNQRKQNTSVKNPQAEKTPVQITAAPPAQKAKANVPIVVETPQLEETLTIASETNVVKPKAEEFDTKIGLPVIPPRNELKTGLNTLAPEKSEEKRPELKPVEPVVTPDPIAISEISVPTMPKPEKYVQKQELPTVPAAPAVEQEKATLQLQQTLPQPIPQRREVPRTIAIRSPESSQPEPSLPEPKVVLDSPKLSTPKLELNTKLYEPTQKTLEPQTRTPNVTLAEKKPDVVSEQKLTLTPKVPVQNRPAQQEKTSTPVAKSQAPEAKAVLKIVDAKEPKKPLKRIGSPSVEFRTENPDNAEKTVVKLGAPDVSEPKAKPNDNKTVSFSGEIVELKIDRPWKEADEKIELKQKPSDDANVGQKQEKSTRLNVTPDSNVPKKLVKIQTPSKSEAVAKPVKKVPQQKPTVDSSENSDSKTLSFRPLAPQDSMETSTSTDRKSLTIRI